MIESPISTKIKAASFQKRVMKNISAAIIKPAISIPSPPRNEALIAPNPEISDPKALNAASMYPNNAIMPIIPRYVGYAVFERMVAMYCCFVAFIVFSFCLSKIVTLPPAVKCAKLSLVVLS